MADRVGQEIGKYRLIRSIGSGGFAEVYLGEHVQLGTQAAIKLLHTGLMNEGEIDQFRQEARIIANLVHPNIVRVLDFDAQAGMPYLVLDYAPGGALRQKYPAGTILPLSLILPAVQQIAQGLQYAHDRKIIHRDVKPQNLLIGRNGEILLSDFGISIVAETTSRQQQSQGFSGTVVYAAPEQIHGHPHPESDQYSLAMIVYEWLTGTPAFTGAMMSVMWNQVHTPPPALRSKVPAISPAVEQVILKALAKDPKDRYPTVQAFATALAQANTGSSVDLPLQPPPPPPPPPTNASSWNSINMQTPSSPFGMYSSGPQSQPNPPQTYPSPSQPFLPTVPSQPFQQGPFQPPTPYPQPTPPPRRQTMKIVLIALIVVILVGAGASAFALILAQSKKGGTTQTITNTPTDTPIPTDTPTPTDTPILPTATPDPRAPYTAQVPGPASDRCDTGGGVWSTPTNESSQVSCSSAGMTLNWPPNSQYLAEVYFYGPRSSYSFPHNYTLSTDTNNLSSNACVGIASRRSGLAGYGFFVCASGYWNIDVYSSSNGTATVLKHGNITGSNSYHLQVTVSDPSQVFQVNGATLATISDTTYTTTSFICLDDYASASGGSAVFSNFVYSPMP